MDTRSRVMEVGRCGYICELITVRSMVSYYVCCRNYMYIYIYLSYTYTMCNTIQEYGFVELNR